MKDLSFQIVGALPHFPLCVQEAKARKFNYSPKYIYLYYISSSVIEAYRVGQSYHATDSEYSYSRRRRVW